MFDETEQATRDAACEDFGFVKVGEREMKAHIKANQEKYNDVSNREKVIYGQY